MTPLLKAMQAVQSAKNALAAAKPSQREKAEAKLLLAESQLARAIDGPSAKSTYKKKTTTVEEEEDTGDDDDGDDDDDSDDEDDEEEEEKMPPSEDEEESSEEDEEEEESSDEEEKAAIAAVALARKSFKAAKNDKARASCGARLAAAKQHLKSTRAKAQKASMREVHSLRVEVRGLTKSLKGAAKVAASNKVLKTRLAAVERFVALGQLGGQPDPHPQTEPAAVSEAQRKIWEKMGLTPEQQSKAVGAMAERGKFIARVTGGN
jgi:cobalamin biosynthesis protein CobT